MTSTNGTASLLRPLGLYGLDRVEDAILAGLAAREPILLLGRHGTAKTLLFRTVAEALGLRYQRYDASKALFEDILGFPNPASLAQGTVDYIPTPLSIWDKEFVFVDEISRANPTTQNKWLEVIREREVMGKRIESLQYVVAAMNPPTYPGAIPLDPALAGRFAWIILMPDAEEMEPADLEQAIRRASPSDAPGLPSESWTFDPAAAERLRGFLDTARATYSRLGPSCDSLVTRYIQAAHAFFLDEKKPYDARRYAMIRRNALVGLAVRIARTQSAKVPVETLDAAFYAALRYGCPDPALGKPVDEQRVRYVHSRALKQARGGEKGLKLLLDIARTRDLAEAARTVVQRLPELSLIDQEDFVSKVEEKLDLDSASIRDARKALEVLAKAMQRGAKFAPDVTRRILRLARGDASDSSDLFGSQPWPPLDPDDDLANDPYV